MDQTQPQATKRCPYCAEEILAEAVKCKHCGQWLTPPQGAAAPTPAGMQSPGTTQPLDSLQLQSVYEEQFDLSRIPPDRRQELKKHLLNTTFPTAAAIILHYVTIGIFTIIYFGLKHSKLPRVRPDDFSAGKAIEFLFIPFFNLYWIFAFWLRLVDRINFQFRLRNLAAPVSRGLVLATVIVGIIPYVGLISWLVLYPIVISQLQSSCNQLAFADQPTAAARPY